MNPTAPNFGGVDDYAPTPWMPPTVNGGSAADAASVLSGFNPGQPNTGMPQPEAKPAGNFFTHALPTLGGILGGLVSLPFELAPGVGTAANIAGAGGGSALGKFLENKLEGNAGGNDVLTSGAEGALGQGVGGILGKVGGMAANKAAGLADTGATKMVQGQFAKGSLDQETAQALRDMGITNANHVPQIASHVTGPAEGSGAALNKGVEKALMTGGTPVDVGGLVTMPTKAGMGFGAPGGMANDLVANETSIGDIAGKKIMATVNRSVQNMLGGSSGKIGQQAADPLDVLKESRVFRKLATQAGDKGYKGAGNAEQAGVSKVYHQLADELEQRAFTPGGQSVPITDELKSEIVKNLEPVKSINPTTHQALVDQVANAKTIEDLRAIQSPFVKANKAFNATERATNAKGGMSATDALKLAAPVAGNSAFGPAGLAGGLAMSALGTKAADRVGASTLGKISDILTNPTMKKIIAASGPVTGQVTAGSPNFAQESQPSNNMNMGAGMEQNPYATGGMQAPVSSPQQELLQRALIGLENPYYADKFAPLAGALVPEIQKATTANAALQQLEQTYSQAGGGQGLLGGLMARLGGAITGGPASVYGGQEEQLNKQLQALGISTPVPQLTNNQPGAQAGFSTLQAIINSLGGGQMTGAPMLAGVPAS